MAWERNVVRDGPRWKCWHLPGRGLLIYEHDGGDFTAATGAGYLDEVFDTMDQAKGALELWNGGLWQSIDTHDGQLSLAAEEDTLAMVIDQGDEHKVSCELDADDACWLIGQLQAWLAHMRAGS